MIYTIPGQGFTNTKSIYEATHLTDITPDTGIGATYIVAGVNSILDVLKAFCMAATG